MLNNPVGLLEDQVRGVRIFQEIQGFLHRGGGLNAPHPGDRWKCRKREKEAVVRRDQSGEAK